MLKTPKGADVRVLHPLRAMATDPMVTVELTDNMDPAPLADAPGSEADPDYGVFAKEGIVAWPRQHSSSKR